MRTNTKYLLLLLLCAVASRGTTDSAFLRDSILVVSSNIIIYMRNSEFDNRWLKGRTVLGANAKARISYAPSVNARFSLGIHVRKEFGDESFLSDARPVFRAILRKSAFSLVVGELLNTSLRHGLHDALIREQFVYDPGVEEGVQLVIKASRIRHDMWAAYRALNTKKHREHISAGNNTGIYAGPLIFSLMAYANHYGGQLYAPANDPVRENIAAATGVTLRYHYEGKISQLGVSQFFLASYERPDRSASKQGERGWGSMSRAWMRIFGTECRFSYFKGNDYVAWEGNRLYLSNKPYYNLQLSKRFNFNAGVFFETGLRLEFIDIDISNYPRKAEHVLWIEVGWNCEKPIRRTCCF